MIPTALNPLGIFGRLPYKRRLEYLESTGTQWIDSGWYLREASSTFEIEVLCAPSTPQRGNWCAICGVNRGSSGEKQYYLIQLYLNTVNKITFHNSDANVSLNSQVEVAPFLCKMQYDGAYSTRCSVNGEELGTITGTISDRDTTTMPIFKAAAALDQRIKAKLYYFRLREEGKLVRDFIPVLDWSDIACMYDNVSKGFFYNAGTGTFNYA